MLTPGQFTCLLGLFKGPILNVLEMSLSCKVLHQKVETFHVITPGPG